MPGAGDRLLQAWRGEIEAGAVYELIAGRERDPERAAILRRMAAAESGHRGRLEARMGQLGIPVPDPASVKLSPWLRLQARLAPVDRLLAAREAAETDEVDDLYLRPTGDEETDRLLHDIRRDERSHSIAVNEMLAAPPAGGPTPVPGTVPGTRGAAQARLDRILGREQWHESGSGWISGAIYGANDGLAAVFGIVTGVSGATGGSSFVLTAGVAGAVASALSMATGAFLAERSELEVAAANVEQERREIAEHPEEEKEELSLFYQLKGLDRQTADALAAEQAEDPDAMLRLLTLEELGGSKAAGNPVESALAAGISTGVGAIIPVIPFVFLTGGVAIVLAGIVSLVAHFAVGAAKSLFTLRSWWASGLEMTLAGVLVGGVTYAIGLAFA
ncbi:MAG TPA: VIT1/CCC1 transporter family protein [Gaiellaceae bacterium]|nr:VIT1/CCC1 transporter family protein [Gaiellaceae bacterium]